MRLLYCLFCNDMRTMPPGSLTYCECGQSAGGCRTDHWVILDGDHARAVTIDDDSLSHAIERDLSSLAKGVRQYDCYDVEAGLYSASSHFLTRPQTCPCGDTTVVSLPCQDPQPCGCGQYALEYHREARFHPLKEKDG